MNATPPPARLKIRYLDEIRPALIERFGYSSVMQAPRLEKITLNMAVGMAKQDAKVLRAATEQLATIAGQRPNVRRARKSIAAFKLREGNPVGVAATLRSERSYEFLDRLVSIAIPRIRDFRGLNPRSFDGRGNYSMGVREQIIFPEIDYDAVDEVRGLDITITTTATSDAEAFALLAALGLPFAAQGRPSGFDTLDATAGDGQGADRPDAVADDAPQDTAEADPGQETAEPSAAQTPDPPAAEAAESGAGKAEAPAAGEAAENGGEGGAEAAEDRAAASDEEPQAGPAGDGGGQSDEGGAADEEEPN